MSARKVGNADLFNGVTLQARSTSLTLSAGDIRIRKNGMEFRSNTTIPVWTEVTIELQTPLEPKNLDCTGVVVACSGNRHAGFVVSMVFTNLSRQAQARLDMLAYSA
jgi:hypothetical protein